MKSGTVGRALKKFFLETLLCRKPSRKAARNPKKDDGQDNSRCACCLKSFLIGRGIECANCGARSCRQSCSHWNSIDETWSCLFCHHQRTQQEKKEISSVATNSCDFNPGGESSQTAFTTTKTTSSDIEHVLSDLHDNSPSGSSEVTTKEKVYEIIEKIVECLVGNVDDTPINRLYNHPAYDQLFNHHRVPLVEALLKISKSLQSFGGNKPAADAASMAHTALRELVERAVDEARKLPRLGDMAVTSAEEDLMIGEQRYEDLLTTAILNKVIENYQKGHSDDDANVRHEKFQCTHVKIGQEINNEDPTSLDTCIECAKDRKFNAKDPIALKIEERIEEVTTLYTSPDDSENSKGHILNFRKARCVPFPEFGVDIVDPSGESSEESEDDEDPKSHINHISPVESWEDNWLFQTKKIPIKSDPVVMLVPNPSSECRALIGNKDAEDTSDLSEFSAQSDEDGEDEIMIEEIYDNLQPPHDFKDSAQLISEEKLNSTSNVLADNHSDINKMTRNVRQIVDSKEITKESTCVKRQNIALSETLPINTINESTDFSKSGKVDDDGNLSETAGELNEKSGNLDETLKSVDILNNEKIQTNVSERESEETSCFSDEKIEDIEPCDEVNSITVRLKKSNKKSLSVIDELKIPQHDVEVKKEENTAINDFLTNEKIIESVNSDKKVEQISLTEDKQSERAKKEISLEGNSEEIESDGYLNNKKIMETAENQEKVLENVNNSICREAEKTTERLPRGLLRKAELDDNESTLATPPRPGTIAEREHKKWENAPPLENNPYSEESIQKRLFQRRLTRINPDVSGNSTVLPTSPSAPLQIVLGAGRPDVKRFGRDYYINEVKIQTSERPGRSGTSNSSRPSSSLSEHSNSTGSDFEPQVSDGLEKFEETSLRDNLHRRIYSGTRASSQFVTNPLVYVNLKHSDSIHGDKNTNLDSFCTSADNINWQTVWNNLDNNFTYVKGRYSSTVSDLNYSESESSSHCTENPLYRDENKFNEQLIEMQTIIDRDSGMYSINSNENEELSIENAAKLSYSNNSDENVKNWIYTNGKKYWALDGNKFHTFGGIKRRRKLFNYDNNEVEAKNKILCNKNIPDFNTDFTRYKFQTFGGIKQSKKNDKRDVNYQSTRKARSSMKLLGEASVKSRQSNLIELKQGHNTEVQVASLIGDNLRLEPPLVPQIIDRQFRSLSEFRAKDYQCQMEF